MSTEDPVPSSRAPAARPTWRRRLVKIGLLLVYVVVLLELGTRLVGVFVHDLPFFPDRDAWYAGHYPELETSGVRDVPLAEDDGHLDVLLLGGSVLEWVYRAHGEDLERTLQGATGKPVRLHSLARLGLSSRDSRAKSELLAGRPFDLVVVYHAINELRMNCCPPELFEADYGHAGWYRKLRLLEQGGDGVPWLSTPRTVRFAWIDLGTSAGRYLPKHDVSEAWLDHGADIKTEAPFRANLEAILARGVPTLLCTFAWYLPADYSHEAFVAKELDYAKHVTPTGTWGRPANVAKGLDVHNAVIRDVAGRHDHVVLVDVEAHMPKDGRHFDDICHFTAPAAERFLGLLAEAARILSDPMAPASRSGG